MFILSLITVGVVCLILKLTVGFRNNHRPHEMFSQRSPDGRHQLLQTRSTPRPESSKTSYMYLWELLETRTDLVLDTAESHIPTDLKWLDPQVEWGSNGFIIIQRDVSGRHTMATTFVR